jgi:PII-like signaling protein
MEGRLLRFYFTESQKCAHGVAWQWVLHEANRMGIPGGSAFRALASFGHHHTLHDFKFLEVMSPLGVMLEFVVTVVEAERLRETVRREGIRTVCGTLPVDFEVLNPETGEQAPEGATSR